MVFRYQYESAQQRFPLWNPHVYLGFPFHANGQSAMLFPFKLAVLFVEPNPVRGVSRSLNCGYPRHCGFF